MSDTKDYQDKFSDDGFWSKVIYYAKAAGKGGHQKDAVALEPCRMPQISLSSTVGFGL